MTSKVLLLDRDEAELTRLVAVLRCEYEVYSTGEPEEALEILKKEPVDLLLVRISLDDRAKELFGWLSRVSKRPKLIFVAPAWSAELLARAAIVGADGVLRSRVPEEVAAAVAAHLCS